MIFLIDVDSIVCFDHDHVGFGSHDGHGGRVKNDEDVDKEQKVESENIIKTSWGAIVFSFA